MRESQFRAMTSLSILFAASQLTMREMRQSSKNLLSLLNPFQFPRMREAITFLLSIRTTSFQFCSLLCSLLCGRCSNNFSFINPHNILSILFAANAAYYAGDATGTVYLTAEQYLLSIPSYAGDATYSDFSQWASTLILSILFAANAAYYAGDATFWIDDKHSYSSFQFPRMREMRLAQTCVNYLISFNSLVCGRCDLYLDATQYSGFIFQFPRMREMRHNKNKS